MKIFFSQQKVSNCIGLLLLVTALAACASGQYEIAAQHDPDPLPVYKKGMTIVYSDGSHETVSDIQEDLISWRDEDGNFSSGKSDFTYRRYTQDSPKLVRTFTPRQDVFFQKATSLWPLKSGNQAHFVENAIRILGDGTEKMYKAHWRCHVVGKTRIKIKAGEFETWKIVGKRFSRKSRASNYRLRETKTWYYSPMFGHFVLTTSNYTSSSKAPKRKEVLAILPPFSSFSKSVKEKMVSVFQATLESNRSGQIAYWSVSDKNISGTITPSGTFQNKAGKFFRRYTMSLNRGQSQKRYFGLVYRHADGTWRIPSLPDGPPGLETLGAGG